MHEIELFQDSAFTVSARPYALQFRFPFKLAVGLRTHTDIVILRIESETGISYGEAALPPYLGATVSSVISFFKKTDWAAILNPGQANFQMAAELPGSEDSAAKAAIDMALHDLHAKRINKTVAGLYGIESGEAVYSTYTIGISSEKELLEKLKEGREFKTIKLKLGSEDDKVLVKTFRKHSNKPFCVDVNQGWKSRDKAARLAEFLEKEGALFVEQPMPATHFEETNWVRQRVGIPIFADESVKRLPDLKYAGDAFDGVNIKLMKSAGIAGAYQMIRKSRELGLQVVLGAMAESSLGNTAAAHLAPLADFVDLDGPMLTSNDPFSGLNYEDGAIVMPARFGIGAVLNENFEL